MQNLAKPKSASFTLNFRESIKRLILNSGQKPLYKLKKVLSREQTKRRENIKTRLAKILKNINTCICFQYVDEILACNAISICRFQSLIALFFHKIRRGAIHIENMMCQYDSLFKSASRYPYISRVPTGEKNLCFVYQFVKNANRYSIGNRDTFHTVNYISGPPTYFPKYGNFPKTFMARKYSYDIAISSWRANVPWDPYTDHVTNINDKGINYIELEFHEHVYPIRVSIYEVYHPGLIIKIWAQDSQNKWFPLWEGSPQILPLSQESRLFSPLLQSCNFKTNRLRLEFCKHSVLKNYTKLDAVMLIGTSELILSRNPAESLTDLLKRINYSRRVHNLREAYPGENITGLLNYMYSRRVHNLTEDYENAHLDIISLQNNFPEHCIQNILDESKELSPFSTLSDEVILEILKHLDLETLCRMNQVNRRFYDLTLDPRLHTRLNMRNIPCPTYTQNILDESKELSPFSTLPDEILVKILKHLDLETLCRMNQVDRRFYNLTLDPLLYTRLNMQNIFCPADIQNIFCYFTPRCKYLQQLDITLCDLSFPATFLQFLDNCGKHLTHLRLRKCVGVDRNIALKISEICKNLKDKLHMTILDLLRYSEPEDKNLNLKYLKLDSTICMGVQAFINILRNVNWMTGELDVHVRFGPGMNLDYVATKLRRSCPDLEIINLEGNYVVSHTAFPDRKNLRKKLEIEIVDDTLNILLSSCQLLEELYLLSYNTRLTDRNLKLLAECKNLKHLHLNYVDFKTPEDVSIIIEQCPKLQKFCLDFIVIKYYKINFYIF
ncbi:hypothetical protein DBV15_06488 [Temnothorax longispinosus]|uniref:F-box domain-containing protein n=1 Tax=Temnothorax longispinosus TaxID=300112 RepID=A0A4S2KE97_9HYME|nr:hypothetical protein DBV15_06488 [Temnothorax longispinosus]